MKIYRMQSAEATACSVFDDECKDLANRYYARTPDLHRRLLAQDWETPIKKFWKERSEDVTPAIIAVPSLLIRAEHADQLLNPNNGKIELLPEVIDGQNWLLVNTLHSCRKPDEASSIAKYAWILDRPGLYDFKWLNIIDPRALEMDVFTIEGVHSYYPFVSQRFVDRVRSLGLVGVTFKFIGHIVDDASKVVPAPPDPPAPQMKTARPPKPPRLKDLGPDTLRALGIEGDKLRSTLGLAADAASTSVLEALTTQIAHWHANIGDFKDAADWSVAVAALSAIYGDLLVRECGWSYAQIVVGRGVWHYGVTSPARTHVLALDEFMRRQVQSGDSTLTLQFNMIKAGQLPPVDPALTPLLLS